MARFRANHTRTSGGGTVRLIIWVIAMAVVLLAMLYWMNQYQQ